MIYSILGCAVSGSELVGILDNFDPAFSLCADFFLNSRTWKNTETYFQNEQKLSCWLFCVGHVFWSSIVAFFCGVCFVDVFMPNFCLCVSSPLCRVLRLCLSVVVNATELASQNGTKFAHDFRTSHFPRRNQCLWQRVCVAEIFHTFLTTCSFPQNMSHTSPEPPPTITYIPI